MEPVILPPLPLGSTVFLSNDPIVLKSEGSVETIEIPLAAASSEAVAEEVVKALPEEVVPAQVDEITVKTLELPSIKEAEHVLVQSSTEQASGDFSSKTSTPLLNAPRMSGATKLKKMLAETDELIVCPGVYDGVSARVALSCGFNAMYMVCKSWIRLQFASFH
jgi:hypothetical protein